MVEDVMNKVKWAQSQLRHFTTLLDRWSGCTARMWELTTSHATATIRIEQRGRVGNLQIHCLGPIHLHTPYEWQDCRLEVDVDHETGNFVVSDKNADVRVVCETVEIKENSKPQNVFTGDETQQSC